jgi:hypothetical protein
MLALEIGHRAVEDLLGNLRVDDQVAVAVECLELFPIGGIRSRWALVDPA